MRPEKGMNQLEAENMMNQVSKRIGGLPEKMMHQLEAENNLNQVSPPGGIRKERPLLQPFGASRGRSPGRF